MPLSRFCLPHLNARINLARLVVIFGVKDFDKVTVTKLPHRFCSQVTSYYRCSSISRRMVSCIPAMNCVMSYHVS